MEKYEDSTKDITNYEYEKAEKKLRLIRNEFTTTGKFNFPIISKQEIDLDCIDLWSWNKAKSNDEENKYKTIHFFTYDWHFDSVYTNPENALNKLQQYYAVLTPDFSLYFDMPLALQIYSTFKNRWCGAYWQNQGLKVIPTVNWGKEDSFEFCFDGIEKGSVVAVSTYSREDYEQEFMLGYNKMLEIIQPSAVICYGTPFKAMTGNIKVIDPFDKDFLMKELGQQEFTRRYLTGELYPSR